MDENKTLIRTQEDSLKKRYFYKISANLVGLVMNFAIQAIIPRGLGPKVYGDFNFLTKFFNEIVNFFDMGTSVGFYTKISQRPRESGLVSFYFYFIGIVSLIVMAFATITHLTSTYQNIWPAQEMSYIYYASIWGILVWIVMILNTITDAYGLTVRSELAKMIQKVFGVILIVLLYVFHQLNLTNFFYYSYATLFFIAVSFVLIIVHSGYSLTDNWRLSGSEISGYCKEFYHYSHPLLVYAFIALVVGVMDRWLLQVYGGSTQQGFFGLSSQIGALCFLFTSAMTPLLIREFSIAFANKDRNQMMVLFRRYIPMLYSIAAYFSCFIAIQSSKVTYIFGGNKYTEAAMAVTVMAFYPIHQTYGQLSGSVFYATGQTALYRNIGVFFMLIGLPITFFLLAPHEKMGFNTGATGLAVKMVILQFIAVNVQLYFNSKFLTFSFWRYFGHQILNVVCLLTIAFGVTFGVDQVLGLDGYLLYSFLLSGVLYTLIVIGVVYCLPVIFGLRRGDIQYLYRLIQGRLRGIESSAAN